MIKEEHHSMKTIYDKNQLKIVEFIGNDDSSMKDLKDLILRNAVFTRANLEGWFLDNCYCEGADFEQADLYWAHLDYCNFSRCNFSNSCLRGISARGVIFWKADLRGADFSRDNLGGHNTFFHCDFSEMKWDETSNFQDACYDEYTIFPKDFHPESHGMKKIHDPYEVIDLSVLHKNILRRHSLKNRNFENENFSQIIFNDCDLDFCTFEHCSCFSTDFSYSSLRNCKFHNSDLIRSIFWKADLRGADFSAGSGKEPADLSDADLREIKYDETTNFSGAYYSARTYFPKSFRPQEHNMQLMESSIDSQWKQF